MTDLARDVKTRPIQQAEILEGDRLEKIVLLLLLLLLLL